MSFVETIERAGQLLQRSKRLSLRALRLEFSLDDEQLDALVEELVEVRHIGRRAGKVVEWLEPEASGRFVRDEQRHLTVMFCDLVGSTELARESDVESYRDAMRGYYQVAGDAVARRGGYVAQYQGDGLLIYFGFPQAYEDDAERAVRTGLAIIDGLANLNIERKRQHKPALAARIGIHTGSVLVSEMGDRDNPDIRAVGEAVNIAARIQNEALPNTVVISRATLRLVQGLYLTRDIGMRALKGVGEMQLHLIVRRSGVRNRLDVAPASLTQFVGRDTELGLIVERWRQATSGNGNAILIEGEAGVGKSRLLRAFRERLADEPHSWFECNCARDRQGSPFYPLLEAIKHATSVRDDADPATNLRRLEGGVARAGLELNDVVPLLATLLAIPLPDTYPPLEISAEHRHRKTMEALCAWITAVTAEQPVVMLVEDLHWCDPSTLSFLELLLERSPATPILVLLSHRQEFERQWPQLPHITALELRRLAQTQAQQLITNLAGELTLPSDVREHIVDRADGVPLYLEELTKMVLESTLVQDGSPVLTAESIPSTLQASLMARLDRLAGGKLIAQLGAVLGRSFPYELLRHLAPVKQGELKLALQQLIDAELLNARGVPPESTYSFKHALIQDAAYSSLLESERRDLHAATANTLVEIFSERAASAPEVVARHFHKANLGPQAIDYYRRAARRAKQQFAGEEALKHLHNALNILEDLPADIDRDRLELDLQVACGAPLYMSRGWASEEYGRRLARARQLALELHAQSKLPEITMGLYFHHQVSGELAKAEHYAREALDTAATDLDLGETLVARAALSQTQYMQGRFLPALDQFEQTMALYESGDELHESATPKPMTAVPRRAVLPADGGSASALWGVRALCRWALGYPDQAVALCEDALSSARQRGTPFNLASACIYAGWIRQRRGEYELARIAAEEACELSERLGFSWRAWAVALRGSVRLEGESTPADNGELAVADILEGIATLRNAGTRGWVPHCYSALAEAYWKLGRQGEAFDAVTQGLDCAAETEQHYEDAELLRLRGEILRAQKPDTLDDVEQSFQAARDTARAQQAKSLELRASIGLARVWRDKGDSRRAHELLGTVRYGFAEGFLTRDWLDASELMESLAS